jgi:hypothetical protein
MVSKIKRGTKMPDYMRKAIEMAKASKPASGFRPETTEEWIKLQAAIEELGYAMLRQSGMSEAAARKLANEIYGGLAGWMLLDIAFRESRNDNKPE